jgi:effector-binding domain-containing protein
MTNYEVLQSNALPRPLAAVRHTVKSSEVPNVIREVLGEVWQFLAEHKIKSTGHNVAVYTPASGASGPDMLLDAWFGVEVHETIPASERVQAISTPAGPVISAVHWGEYNRLSGAYEALHAWRKANDRPITSTSWEVYGDWFDDWAKVRTDVFFQLAD